MVMAVGFQADYEELRNQVEALKQHYAERLAYYTDESSHVSYNLKTRYLMTIGQKEYQVFCRQVEISRLKREISLYQAALNRGVKTTPEAVRKVIEDEFADYQRKMAAQKQEMEAAKEYFLTPTLSAEKSEENYKLYKSLLRQLHPDLNPGLPEEATQFLHKVQDAFKSGNWPELRLLADLVHDLALGKGHNLPHEDGLEAMRHQRDELTEKLSALEQQIGILHSRPPFTFQKLLEDPEAIRARRAELDENLEKLREQEDSLRALRDELRRR